MEVDVAITVTWMDGKTEIYRYVLSHTVKDGVLTINQSRGPLPDPCPETLHLPVANIRKFTVEGHSDVMRRRPGM